MKPEMKKMIKSGKKEIKEAAYSIKNMAWNEIHNLGDSYMPILKKSQFEDGILTPEQFVDACDTLIMKCPSWQWGTYNEATTSNVKSYLPKINNSL